MCHTRTLAAAALVVAACSLVPSIVHAQLPEDGRKVLAYYVGMWQYEWSMEGETYRGTWSAKWSPDESCLLSHWSSTGPNGPRRGTKITGWDAAKCQSVDLEFSANGEHVLSRYTIESDKVAVGKGVGSTSGGKVSRCKLRVDRERDRFTWTASDRMEGDERMPDLVFLFRRVADKK
jgi:hypothetical protein